MAQWRKPDASNKPDTCLWCGSGLRHPRHYDFDHKFGEPQKVMPRYEKGGDYHDGFFCGLRCAYQFAEKMAQFGHRIAPL
jgi:hypothetical protein